MLSPSKPLANKATLERPNLVASANANATRLSTSVEEPVAKEKDTSNGDKMSL